MAAYLVYGSGGFAREVAWLAEAWGHHVAALIDDDQSRTGRVVNDVPVRNLAEAVRHHPDALVVAGIGDPEVREHVMARAAGAGLRCGLLVHPRVEQSKWLTVGQGTVICAGCILTTNIAIGENVQINLDCTIGHDAVLQDFVTLAPGVHVSGWVRLERGAYVG